MFLKVLVGVAAVAVIAFVGYYFYAEWHRADEARKDREFQLARAECLTAVDRYASTLLPALKPAVEACADLLLISADDTLAARKKYSGY